MIQTHGGTRNIVLRQKGTSKIPFLLRDLQL